MQLIDQLCYWIEEREKIRELKTAGYEKPWSRDPVFQHTYFCNVHREDDRVTKWIRENFSQHLIQDYEWLMGMARLLNKPESLALWVHPEDEVQPHHVTAFIDQLRLRADEGVVIWGNAYVVTTHGRKMNKLDYLEEVLLNFLAVGEHLKDVSGWGTTCKDYFDVITQYEGFGSFMAAQVIADLKNTTWHYLHQAGDKESFVAPGPGSLRGLAWVTGQKVSPHNFNELFEGVKDDIDRHMPDYRIDAQDLQNCLCEFDKYCRVKNKTGRSKRKYPGDK